MISKGARDSIHLLGRRHQAFQDDAIGYDLNHTTFIYRIISILAAEKNKNRILNRSRGLLFNSDYTTTTYQTKKKRFYEVRSEDILFTN